MTQNENLIIVKSQKIIKWNAQKIYYNFSHQHQRNYVMKRGEVYFADLGENIGSEENKIRPVVVIQSNAYNYNSPVVIIAIISSSHLTIPDIQVKISNEYMYINHDGIEAYLKGTIDLGQIRTIAKERIVSNKVCKLKTEMKEIDKKLLNIVGLTNFVKAKDNTILSLRRKIDYLNEGNKLTIK